MSDSSGGRLSRRKIATAPSGVSRWWFSFFISTLAVLAAVLLRLWLDPILHDRAPFGTLFPAVAVAVFFGRLPGGLMAIFMGTLAADYLFLSPRGMLGTQGAWQATELAIFMAGSAILVLFGEMMHSARDKAEELRQEAEDLASRTDQIFETANEGIWILNSRARIIKVNPRLCEMLGFTAAEMLGAAETDFFFAEDGSSASVTFARRRQGVSDQADARFRTKAGGTLWALRAARPLFSEQGVFQGTLDMFTDITQRKQAEEQLAHVAAERSERLHEIAREMELFSYSMAHDLRAPLRAMQGLARVVLEDFGNCLPEAGQDHLKRMAASANRMDRLILDVLHYSHLVRGELPMHEVDVHRLIEEMLASFPDLHPFREDIVIEGSLPIVLANPSALTQVISNLLTNAVKFVAPGVPPRVRIWSEPIGAYVRFSFQDNGIGISKKGQQKIFGLFQRLHAADSYDGTGIGLAIVKKATERLGGQVGLDSEPGKGSRFWFTLKECRETTSFEEKPLTQSLAQHAG
jgi:PAS domain S-box-containing protein